MTIEDLAKACTDAEYNTEHPDYKVVVEATDEDDEGRPRYAIEGVRYDHEKKELVLEIG